jgi:hypothetical protein
VPDWFHSLKDRFQTCRDNKVSISSSREGSLFLIHHNRLARFDHQGRKQYAIELPASTLPGRACIDGAGNALLLVSARGRAHKFCRSLRRVTLRSCRPCHSGGGFCREERLAMASDGTLYAAGYGGQLRVFASDGTLRHTSEPSLQEENVVMERFRREAE